jgi:hypothetical protein
MIGRVTNVQMRVHILRTFITCLLVHIHQKKKIALEIAAKIASVNWPLRGWLYRPLSYTILQLSYYTAQWYRPIAHDVTAPVHLEDKLAIYV